MPPGRLTDESIRTASCLEFASTFHLRAATYARNVRSNHCANMINSRMYLCYATYYQISNFWIVPAV